MAPPRKYNYEQIAQRREDGTPWADLAAEYGVKSSTLRGMFSRWLKQENQPPLKPAKDSTDEPAALSKTKKLTREDISRILSLNDLIQFFGVDTDLWEVRDYRLNKWEQHSNKKGIVPLYQVRANFIPNLEHMIEIAREEIASMLAEAEEHAPVYAVPERAESLAGASDDPMLFELAIFDPHIGMLAWGEEVGADYDSKIAVRDYGEAVEHLLSYAQLYNTERILYVVGNDFLHVDAPGVDVKGNVKGGATTSGTGQDIDSRLPKMFTVGRRALVAGIDRARLIAPVDVLVVPGNHDEQQMYRMGEVLSAWYRKDSEVNVLFGPAKRKFYAYGKNAWMFTHGEKYKRQRDNLPLIFATECPSDLWANSVHREIHTGHNHGAMAGRYTPESDLTESRGIRTRSLAAFTPEDAWHYDEGYKHRRTATSLVYRHSGGIAGLHEFNL